MTEQRDRAGVIRPDDIPRPYEDLAATVGAEEGGGGVTLLGTRCEECDMRMSGTRYACSRCMSRELAEHRFGPGGTLYSYSEVHTSEEPFVLGYVDLDEGVRVLTTVDADIADLHCDRPVELALRGDDWVVRPTSETEMEAAK